MPRPFLVTAPHVNERARGALGYFDSVRFGSERGRQHSVVNDMILKIETALAE
jgi:hypothetical protein